MRRGFSKFLSQLITDDLVKIGVPSDPGGPDCAEISVHIGEQRGEVRLCRGGHTCNGW